MSGIFGLIRFDGAPVAEHVVAQMQSTMAHWGPDANRQWIGEGAALGQCLFWDTPESVNEPPPGLSDDGALAFTAEARVDNRDDLAAALDVDGPELSAMADGELIRRAYRRWGSECAQRILGDWSFAAWEPASRRLMLARDHHGNTSLYFTMLDGGRAIGFASDRRALSSLHSALSLNELYLAQLLVSWPAYHGRQTIQVELERLPPAHILIVKPSATLLHRYWRLEDTAELRLSSQADYADGLKAVLRHAVRARLRSRNHIAATLSGGLDSGAVTAVAAQLLHDSGRELIAVTAAGAGPLAALDLNGAAATAQSANVHLTRVASTIDPIHAIDRLLEIHGEPGHAAINYYWLIPLLEAVRGRIVLTGQTGNGSFSWNGIPSWRGVARAVGEGRRADALMELSRLLVAQEPFASVRVAARLARARRWNASWLGQSMIDVRFAQRLELRRLMRDAGHDPFFRPVRGDSRAAHLRVLRPGRDLIGGLWAELAAAVGCVARDPLRDVRLLSYAYSVPNDRWRGPRDRWLARCAVAGMLPDSVRRARRRGVQGADIGDRLVPVVPALLARLNQERRVTEGILDVGAIERSLRHIAAHPERAWSSASALLRVLCASRFLHARSEEAVLR